jgi:predicted nucleotide-binding protein
MYSGSTTDYPSALILALQKAIVATFSETEWLELGLKTDSIQMVEGHSRLLRSLDFGDPDYGGCVIKVVRSILGRDDANLKAFRDFPRIDRWLQENDHEARRLLWEMTGEEMPVQREEPLVQRAFPVPTPPPRQALPQPSPPPRQGMPSLSPARVHQAVSQPTSPPRMGQPAGGLDLGVLDGMDIEEGARRLAAGALPKPRKVTNKRVFVVHGHDDGMVQAVARFLEGQGLEPIILGERASRGMTLIAKLEAHSDVGFAVVLVSPCDRGFKRGAPAEEKPRARQNVIFEWGYFMALLRHGQDGQVVRNVQWIVKKDEKGQAPEGMSDIAGTVWLRWDDGSWKGGLAKELDAAGYNIDFRKVV